MSGSLCSVLALASKNKETKGKELSIMSPEPEFKSKPLAIPLIKLLKTNKQGHIDLEHAVVEMVKSINALIKWVYEYEMQSGIRPRPKEIIKKKETKEK